MLLVETETFFYIYLSLSSLKEQAGGKPVAKNNTARLRRLSLRPRFIGASPLPSLSPFVSREMPPSPVKRPLQPLPVVVGKRWTRPTTLPYVTFTYFCAPIYVSLTCMLSAAPLITVQVGEILGYRCNRRVRWLNDEGNTLRCAWGKKISSFRDRIINFYISRVRRVHSVEMFSIHEW